MRLAIGDIAVLSEGLLKFFNDFRNEKEAEEAKSCSFLVVDIDKDFVDVLSPDGELIRFTKHDLQLA